MPRTRSALIKITLSLLCVAGLYLLFAVGQPVGTTFANGSGLQLTVGSESYYNGVPQGSQTWALKDLVPGVDTFFALENILPGDRGLNLMSIRVENNPAYICLDTINLADDENGGNEPESHEDVTLEGELSEAIELFSWRDDGDGVFEVGETPLFGTTTQSAIAVLNNTSFPLADASTNEIFEEDVTYYVGIEWCFGDLTVDLATAAISCNGEETGNEYQTDSFTFDASLRAVEATFYTDYTCDPTVDLYLNKQISGEYRGFELSDFSYRVTGTSTFGYEYIDEIVPHDSTIELPVGTFTIEELVPEGFVKDDWRIGWYGQCDAGDEFTTTITIEPRDTRLDILYCEADNQYRPDDKKPKGDNGHGNDADENDDSNPGASNDVADDTDDDGVPPGQRWREVERPGVFSNLRNRSSR